MRYQGPEIQPNKRDLVLTEAQSCVRIFDA